MPLSEGSTLHFAASSREYMLRQGTADGAGAQHSTAAASAAPEPPVSLMQPPLMHPLSPSEVEQGSSKPSSLPSLSTAALYDCNAHLTNAASRIRCSASCAIARFPSNLCIAATRPNAALNRRQRGGRRCSGQMRQPQQQSPHPMKNLIGNLTFNLCKSLSMAQDSKCDSLQLQLEAIAS